VETILGVVRLAVRNSTRGNSGRQSKTNRHISLRPNIKTSVTISPTSLPLPKKRFYGLRRAVNRAREIFAPGDLTCVWRRRQAELLADYDQPCCFLLTENDRAGAAVAWVPAGANALYPVRRECPAAPEPPMLSIANLKFKRESNRLLHSRRATLL
jgi:hypothetical protein